MLLLLQILTWRFMSLVRDQTRAGSAPREHLVSSQSKFFWDAKVSMRNLQTVSPLGSLGCLKALDCLIASPTQSQLHLLVVHPGKPGFMAKVSRRRYDTEYCFLSFTLSVSLSLIFGHKETVNTVVSWSPPCRIKRQENYLETERVCGALPRGWLPQLMFDP